MSCEILQQFLKLFTYNKLENFFVEQYAASPQNGHNEIFIYRK